MFFIKASILFLFFASTSAAIDNSQDWELAKQENGIKVYTRKIDNSSYKEFRGEMDINAKIDQLLPFINDGKHCAVWRYKCINMLNLSDGYIYKLSHLPWPFKNRYTVMKSVTSYDQQNKSYTIELKNIARSQLPQQVQAQLPKQENTVQMRYSAGFWRLTPNPALNNVHITYQMHGDANVALPSDWTHHGIINSAFITLNNLKKQFTQVD